MVRTLHWSCKETSSKLNDLKLTKIWIRQFEQQSWQHFSFVFLKDVPYDFYQKSIFEKQFKILAPSNKTKFWVLHQTSANQGADSRFVVETIFKPLVPKLNQSSIMIPKIVLMLSTNSSTTRIYPNSNMLTQILALVSQFPSYFWITTPSGAICQSLFCTEKNQNLL